MRIYNINLFTISFVAIASLWPDAPAASQSTLSSDERGSLSSACSFAHSRGPQELRLCENEFLRLLATEPPPPDLSRLSAEERGSLSAACSSAYSRGPVALRRCHWTQIQSLRDAPSSPDLSRLTSSERGSLSAACSSAYSQGPYQLRRCHVAQVARLAGRAPLDLSRLTSSEQGSLSAACSSAYAQGPEALRSCQERHLADANQVARPDLSTLNWREQGSVSTACSAAYGQGPAALRRCQNHHLVALGLRTPAASVPSQPPQAVLRPPPTPAVASAAAPSLPELRNALRAMPGATQGSMNMQPDEVFARTRPLVWRVQAAQSVEALVSGRGISHAMAVAVAPDRLLTSCQVLANRPAVVITQGERVHTATIVGGDLGTNRCVISPNNTRLTAIASVRPFADLLAGERSYAVDAHSDLGPIYSERLIAGKRTVGGLDYVQISRPLSPGSTGAPLFDSRGNLIGIATFLSQDQQSLLSAAAADSYWR